MKRVYRFAAGHRPSKTLAVNLVLVDLGLPDGDGISLIQDLNQLTPCPKSLVITVFGDEKHVLSAFEAGAVGYLMKEDDDDVIADWVCKVIDGQSPVSPSIAHHLLKRFRSRRRQASTPGQPSITPDKSDNDGVEDVERVRLTPREMEVLELIAKGFGYKDIAKLLGITVNTVTSHAQHIYGKLQVKSRSEAVFEAHESGLLDRSSGH